MWIKKKIVLTLSLLISLTACNKEETPQVEKGVLAKKQNCIYSLKEAKVNWTSYKFTEKKGVGGTFDSTILIAPSQSVDPLRALEKASLVIDAQSVNSNLPLRDERLRKFFFGPLLEMGSIKTIIKSIDSLSNGKVVVVMNGIEKELDFKAEYTDKLSLKASINLNDFNTQSSITSLNKECKDLHIGSDGKSVLWPDVDVNVEFVLDEQCG